MSKPIRRWLGRGALLAIASVGGCTAVGTSPPVAKSNNYYAQGVMAYQDGDKDRAMEAVQAALQENPDSIMARSLLGTIHREKGQYEASATQYQRVTELDPFSYTSHYNLGLAYHLLNRLQEAVVAYLQALKLNPADMKSNMYLGMAYAGLGKPEEGLPYVRRATELDPKSAEAMANLAVVLDTLRDYAEAERAYRRALELDSNRPDTAINLGGCLMAQKRFDEAISVYEQLLKSADSSLLRQRYGYALLQSNRLDSAAHEFQRALKQDPKNWLALNGLGDALIGLYRQGAMLDEAKRTAAVLCWKKSLEINPRQSRITALVTEYSNNRLFP